MREKMCSFSWEVRAEASMCCCSHLPGIEQWDLVVFIFVQCSVSLCFPFESHFLCIPIIKIVCNSCNTSHIKGLQEKVIPVGSQDLHVCNLSTQEAEAGPSGAQSHNEFRASLGYTVRLSLKNKHTRCTEETWNTVSR